MRHKLCHQKASTLLITMLMMLALLTLVSVFIDSTLHSGKVSLASVQKMKAKYAAEAGIHKAIYALRNTASTWKTPAAYSGDDGTCTIAAGTQLTPCYETFTDASGNATDASYTVWVVATPGGTALKITSKGTVGTAPKEVSNVIETWVTPVASNLGAVLISGHWTEKTYP